MKIKLLLLLLINCLLVSKAFCAVDVFMAVSNVNGPYQFTPFKNYFKLNTTNLIDKSSCTFSSTFCNGTAGEFTVDMAVSNFAVSAQLKLFKSPGEVSYPSVDIVYTNAGSGGNVFYQVHLTDVKVTSILEYADENVGQQIGFSYKSISWKYTPYTNNVAGTPITGCFNTQSNSSCTYTNFPF